MAIYNPPPLQQHPTPPPGPPPRRHGRIHDFFHRHPKGPTITIIVVSVLALAGIVAGAVAVAPSKSSTANTPATAAPVTPAPVTPTPVTPTPVTPTPVTPTPVAPTPQPSAPSTMTYSQCMADPSTTYEQCQALPDAPQPTPTPTPTPSNTGVPVVPYNTAIEITKGNDPTTIGTVSVAKPVVAYHDPGYTTSLGDSEHGEFLVFTVTATAARGQSNDISSYEFEARLKDGTVYHSTYSDGWGPTLPSGNIESGGKVKGTVVFDIPNHAHGYLVYNPNMFGDDAGIAKWVF